MKKILILLLLSSYILSAQAATQITLLEENPLFLKISFINTQENTEKMAQVIRIPNEGSITLELLESTFTDVSNTVLTDTPVTVTRIGQIREAALAQMLFFPEQSNKIYTKIIIQINFSMPQIPSVIEESSTFNRLWDNILLNPQQAISPSHPTTTRTDCLAPLFPNLKLSINKTGVYTFSYQDFINAGLTTEFLESLDPRHIELSHKDHAVNIFFAGEEDGVLGQEDIIYFYAEKAEDPYTHDNIYRFSLNLEGGARLNFKDSTPNTAHPAISTLTHTVHIEENNIYWTATPHNHTHLFWNRIFAGDAMEIPITIPHLSASVDNATIRVKMQGRTKDTLNPDHHTQILLNGVSIDDKYWDGQEYTVQTAQVSQSQLLEHNNIISIVSLGDTGAAIDSFYLDWIEVEYVAKLNAIDDVLQFKIPGEGLAHFTIGGFTQPNILVLDITDPLQVEPLEGGTIQAEGIEHHSIQYSHHVNNTYYAFSLDAQNLLKPATVTLDVSTVRLHSPCNKADYFIIHHDSFNVEAFKNIVASRGLEVMTVPVSDIYDEFSQGMRNPQAIKDFLTYAYYNYTAPRPAYVALVGDANQDVLNELGHGITYVPSYTFETAILGTTTTDDWFVSVNGSDDFLPDMFLGRIPVKTQAELDAIVNKWQRYSQAALTGWQNNVLLVTDNILEFDVLSEHLIDTYLDNYTPQRVYLGDYTDTNNVEMAQQDIIQHINTGAVLTTYSGHGSISNWAGEFIFDSQAVELLNNPDTLTFVLALNCLNGWFTYYKPIGESTETDSLAEAFLKAENKGAIGMWAPTGLGNSYEHEKLAEEFFRRLFHEHETELGLLTMASKITLFNQGGISSNMLGMYLLFGDPSLSLRLD